MENYIDIQCINNELIIKDEELYNICINNIDIKNFLNIFINTIKIFFYKNNNSDNNNNFFQKNDSLHFFNNFKNEFFEKFNNQNENIIEKIIHERNLNYNINQTIINNLNDTLNDKFDNERKIGYEINKTLLNTLDDKLDSKNKEILNEVKLSNEKFTSFKNQNHIKCIEGEDYIHNLLSQYFTNNDGYTIQKTNEIKHKGDFVISKNNIDKTILIDVKNYSGKVPDKEVQKFFKDMDMNNSHGILISINSDISGKHFLFEKYKNNTFAIFIPNLSSSPDSLRNMIYIIFAIEEIIANDNKDIYISNDTFENITSTIKTYNIQIKNIIDSLQSNIRSLEKIKLDSIYKLIYNNIDNISSTSSITSTSSKKIFICKYCSKEYVQEHHYKNHLKNCDKNI